MSPAGGVGINFAVQDAVAAANILVPPLRAGTVAEADLARVQRRRAWPVSVTQRLQAMAHRRLFGGGAAASGPVAPSPLTTLVLRPLVPLLRRFLARVIGIGIRPEHVQTPDVRGPAQLTADEAG
jgi:2-polyprenyl-6-methoxyphenol hydroxylase-like FAD-dependent oxidoreductase